MNSQFLLFAWPLYRDWGGGWDDFIGCYDTVDEAWHAYMCDHVDYECFNIVDVNTLRVIKSHVI